MNLEPYIPLATALVTLCNTVLLLLNRRRLRHVERKTNGMQMQLLAEAEQRGRRQATGMVEVSPVEPDATSARGDSEPGGRKSR